MKNVQKGKRIPAEERKQQIINAAMKVFATKGFQGTRTKDIAKAAGVSEAMVFKFFKNKDDIYNSIISKVINDVKDHKEFSDMQSQDDDFTTVLKEVILQVINDNEKDPTFLRLMLYSLLEEPKFVHSFMKTHLLGQMDVLTKVIEKGVENGKYRRFNPNLAAHILEYMMGGYCIEQLVLGLDKSESFDKNEVAETMIDIFLNGLKKT